MQVRCIARRLRYVASPLMGLCFAVACSTASDVERSSTRIADSAGVAIANGPAVDTPLPWTLTERRRIGGADSGAQSFTRVTRSNVSTDGRSVIVVLDRDNNNRIHLFDSTGALLRSMGRRGGGPGETEESGDVLISASGVVSVYDYMKTAVVRYGATGTPLDLWRVSTTRGHPWSAQNSGDTMFVTVEATDSARQIRRLERWTPRDTVAYDSTVTPKPKMVMFKCIGLALAPLFSPELTWSVQGTKVALTTQSRYVVDVYDGQRLVRSLRRDILPVPAKPSDASRLYPEGMKVTFSGGDCVTPAAEFGEKVGVAATIPVVRGAVIAPDNSLWIERFSFDGETPSVDVFNAAGNYVGTLTGRALPLGFLGADHVLFPIKNPDDDTAVIGIFQIVRSR